MKRVPNPSGRGGDVWARDSRVSDDEMHRRMGGLFDRMTQEGLAIKHEVSMDNVTVENKTVTLPPEAHALMDKIASHYPSRQRAISLMAQRNQQEPYKIAAVVEGIKADLAAGRRPIVFAGRVNESTVGGEDENDKNAIAFSEGTLKTLKEALAKEGITDVSEVHGGVSDAAKSKGVADFQSGKNRVLIGTGESAGTGINLDDTVGNAPRTITNMTAPYSANEVIQRAGRGNRLSTKSPLIVRNLYADTDVDDWNRAIVTNKLKTAGAAVGGDVRKLDVDYKPESQEAPYQWRPLTRQAQAAAAAPNPAAIQAAPTSPKPAGVASDIQPRFVPKLNKYVHNYAPDESHWKLWKSGSRPSFIGSGKNPRTGAWEGAVWGKTADEVRANVHSLRQQGVNLSRFDPVAMRWYLVSA